MDSTNIKGLTTELQCQTYFIQLGYIVSVPLGPQRYDFILDTGKELLKIQVKSCNNTDPAILEFSTKSVHYNKTNGYHNVSYDENENHNYIYKRDFTYTEIGKDIHRSRQTVSKNFEKLLNSNNGSGKDLIYENQKDGIYILPCFREFEQLSENLIAQDEIRFEELKQMTIVEFAEWFKEAKAQFAYAGREIEKRFKKI